MDLKAQMDGIYGGMPLDEIPWNRENPPDILVDLVETGRIAPCDAVDLGCGAGNNAVWLASRGFRVTGLELSPRAVELAEERANKHGVDCRFIAADLTTELSALDASFDFAYDWEVLHHVFPEDRERYVANAHRMLRAGGRYLSLCFSEDDSFGSGGDGKYRTTPLGTTLYFSSEAELRELFEMQFRVEELRTVEVPGKHGPHLAVMASMVKNEPRRG